MRLINKKSLILAISILLMLLMVFPTSAETYSNADEPAYGSYSYWNGIVGNNHKTPVYSKPIYQTLKVIDINQLVGYETEMLKDVFCDKNGYTYILDSSIPMISILDKDYNLVNNITVLKSDKNEDVEFKGAESLIVTDDGDIYLCGTRSECVWIIDQQGNIKKTLLLPDSEIIPDDFIYLPAKVSVDSRGYIYILSQSCYYGAILYSPQYEFLGFYGSNTVQTTAVGFITNVWNKLFMNDTKKSSSLKALPFSFTDLEIGEKDFVYTITGNTGSNLTRGQLRILNPAGVNILNKSNYNFSDGRAVTAGVNRWINQDLSGIAVGEDYIYVLDSGHGKIFVYDTAGNILGTFGGGYTFGEQKGLFKKAMGITLSGDNVVVIDAQKNTLTIFEPTDYGKLVMECQSLTLDSKYLDAKEGWEEVLTVDKNSQLAYRGLARAALRNKEYESAMELAKIAYDRDTYSEAMTSYRKVVIAENFAWAIPVLAAIIGLIVFACLYVKKKNITLIKSPKLKNYFFTLFHPFDGFANVKEKGYGSVIVATVLCALLYVSSVVKEVSSGFAYSTYTPQNFNSLYVLVKSVGVIVLWTIINWAVCTLFGGLGKMKEIYIAINYCATPLIISNFAYALLSNVLLEDEIGFLNIMVTLFWIYAGFLLVAASSKIHDYSFGAIVGTSVATVVGILIVIFLAFIIFLLLQQLGGFLLTVGSEIIYR